VELARIPGASGAVNVRLPDPTNDPFWAGSHPLDLIALAVDQGGNVRANSRPLTISHDPTTFIANGVFNPGGDASGSNGQRFELTFLAPPSGIPTPAIGPAHPALGTEAGLVGQSQYILEYLRPDAIATIRDGGLARLSFYYLAPNNDPLRANLGAAAAIGLPGYVAAFNEVYYLIQDVEGDPYQVNWTLQPTRGLVALIFNNRGHSSHAPDVLPASFMVRATALACPAGPYSILANQPIVATYLVEWWNAPVGANVEYEMRYRRVVPPGGTATLPGSNTYGSGAATTLGAGPGDGSGLARSHLVAGAGANDLSSRFDPAVGGPGTGTYRQILAVQENATPVERTFALCPTFDVNP
jgi:hypothetical protein